MTKPLKQSQPGVKAGPIPRPIATGAAAALVPARSVLRRPLLPTRPGVRVGALQLDRSAIPLCAGPGPAPSRRRPAARAQEVLLLDVTDLDRSPPEWTAARTAPGVPSRRSKPYLSVAEACGLGSGLDHLWIEPELKTPIVVAYSRRQSALNGVQPADGSGVGGSEFSA